MYDFAPAALSHNLELSPKKEGQRRLVSQTHAEETSAVNAVKTCTTVIDAMVHSEAFCPVQV